MASLFHLGPCNVYDASGIANVDIGPTEGGVNVGFDMDVSDILTDQDGTQPLEQIVTGMGGTITIPMTALTFSKLTFVIPGSEFVSAGGGTSQKLYYANSVGLNLVDQAKPLLLKRFSSGIESVEAFTTIGSDVIPNWITALLAAPSELGTIDYLKDGQQILEVVFRCYPDPNTLTPLGKKAVFVLGSPPSGLES